MPVVAALIACALERVVHRGVETGGLALLGSAVALPLLRRGLAPGLATSWLALLVPACALLIAGLAATLYPIPYGASALLVGVTTVACGLARRELAFDILPLGCALVGCAGQRAASLGFVVAALVLPALRRGLPVPLPPALHRALALLSCAGGLLASSVEVPFFVPMLFAGGAVVVALSQCLDFDAPDLGRPDAVALLAIVGLCLGLRAVELTTVSLSAYFDLAAALDRGAWRLLVPFDIGDGAVRWSTTGLVVTSALERVIGSRGAFLLLAATNIAVSYGTVWSALRSRASALTVAMCAALGTHFHYYYVNMSVNVLYLFTTYVLVNLLCLWKVGVGARPATRWRASFVASLLVLALCWEMWLDYASFLSVGLALAWLRHRKTADVEVRARLRFLSLCIGALAVIYVPCKVVLGGAAEHLRRGQEAELVLTYFDALPPRLAATVATEDVVVNALTYHYIATSNFLPPPLVFSSSARSLDVEQLVEQAGHGRAQDPALVQRLIAGNYLMAWRFLAGAMALVLYVSFALALRAWWREPSPANALPAGVLLLVILGASTHLLIKYRYYNGVPLLSYKCIVSIVGVTLLVGLAADWLKARLSPSRFRAGLAALWLSLVWGALDRPRLLRDLCRLGGLGDAMPDPVANAEALALRAMR